MTMASIGATDTHEGGLRRPLRLAGGLALVGCALYLTLALATWNVADPSLSQANDNPVTNLAGPSGAVLADLAMQIFGLSAVLLAVLPAVWGIVLAFDRRIGNAARRGWMAMAGVLFASAAIGCLPAPSGWPLPIGLGGIAGDLVLRVPALATGAYPSGLLGIVLAILFAIPAGWLFLTGAAVLGRPKAAAMPTLSRRAPANAAAARTPAAVAAHLDEDEDRGPGRLQLLAGAVGHAVFSARAALARKRAQPKNEVRAPRVEPGAFFDDEEFARPPVRAPREIPVRVQAMPEPVPFDFPDAEDDYADTYAQPSHSAPAAAAAMVTATAAAAASYAAPQVHAAPVPQPQRRAVDTSRATVRQGRSDWNGSYAASRLGQPRGGASHSDFAGDGEDAGFDDNEMNSEGFAAEDEAVIETAMWEVEREDHLHLVADDRIQPEPAMAAHEPATWRERAANIVTFPSMRRKAEVEPTMPTAAATPRQAVMEPPVRVVPAAPQPVAARQSAQPTRVYQGEPAHAYAPEYFELPPIDLLSPPKPRAKDAMLSPEILQENARLLEGVLDDFGVKGEIIEVRPGPVVTLYELEPAPGIKSSRVIGLADDIARSMSAIAARVAVIPGKNAIGIELPNQRRETVYFREMIGSENFANNKAKLALALGKTIGGEAVIADLAKMPHLLVAGTTGSGKSVSINTMILSLLYKMTPAECRMIMIDPKMLELSVYDGIPHLLAPVVTDPKKAVVALKWTVREMEDRYRKMSKVGVRNIDGFNARVRQAIETGETISRTVQTGFDRETGEPIFESEEFDLAPLPYIVVIIDEMADLMMVAGKEIEGTVQRLAQMARAAGIHVIMATQRPSVDVITGTIKANFPTRISFQVTSKIDSRTILQEQGAEQLLGQGDMLFMAGGGRIQRVHGPFVDDAEVEEIVRHLKLQGVPDYLDAILEEEDDEDGGAAPGGKGGDLSGLEDSADLYDQAVAVVLRDGKASTSYVQRRLGIGYNRAASLIERMEKEGVIGAANHAGKREILVPTDNA